jgi:dTDP-4-amino-4,6-dideoxygalactose transaminase
MVIANAVKWAGLKPVFVDCNRLNLNYDLKDIQKKISDKTRAIVVQHTFGYPENMQIIKEIAGDNVFIIEDLAHSLGGQLDGKKLGTFGDAAILTFGIEKVISSIRGGMLIVKDESLAQKIYNTVATLKPFPKKKTSIALLGALLWKISTPIYYFGFGKITLGRMLVYIAHRLGLMGNMIEDCEYETCQPKWLPSKMSPTLALLGINQFNKLEKLNNHRIEIATIYQKELEAEYPQKDGTKHIFLRFPLIIEKRDELLMDAKQQKIVLGDWYKNILYAPDKTLALLGYIKGSCPNAEYLAKQIINLPTYINLTKEDAIEISNLVKKYL